jgi:hypothetical protein
VGLRLGYVIARSLVGGLVLLGRSDAAKDAEILLLWHQLAVLHRQAGRPHLTWTDRVVIAALARRLPPARRIGVVGDFRDDPALASSAGRAALGSPPGGGARAAPGSRRGCGRW